MANTASARKRAAQAAKRGQRDSGYRSMVRGALRKTARLIAAGSASEAEASHRDTTSLLDRFARREMAHKNKAARHKSRLSARLRALATAAPASAEPPPEPAEPAAD